MAQPCVFVKQLPGPILCALPYKGRDPLSRSYRVSLPSSLTVNHSSALEYSSRLRVSVCGTGTCRIKFSGLSRQHAYAHYCLVPKDAAYCQVRISWLRQRPDHYTIRAGRNLPDKEFRYLRTVIVTAAVYWGFNSMLLLR